MFIRKRFMNLHRLDTCRAERVVKSRWKSSIFVLVKQSYGRLYNIYIYILLYVIPYRKSKTVAAFVGQN